MGFFSIPDLDKSKLNWELQRVPGSAAIVVEFWPKEYQ